MRPPPASRQAHASSADRGGVDARLGNTSVEALPVPVKVNLQSWTIQVAGHWEEWLAQRAARLQ